MSDDSFWDESLTPEIIAKANTELGETTELKEESLKQLKLLIKNDCEFEPLTEDAFLLRFLRVRKFDAKRALKTLKNYYGYKARHSGLVTDLTPRDIGHLLDQNYIYVSPVRDRDGGVVVIFSLGVVDLDTWCGEQFLGAILCVVDRALDSEWMQVAGVTAVYDYTGITARHFKHYFRPSFIRTSFGSIMNTFPVRVKGLHAVNEPRHVHFLCNTLVRPFLPQKINDRMFLHGKDMESLHKHVPPDCLPNCLGGLLSNQPDERTKAEMFSGQDRSERLRQYVYKGKSYPAPLHKKWTHSR